MRGTLHSVAGALLLAAACSAGTGSDGFASAASLGGGDATVTSTGSGDDDGGPGATSAPGDSGAGDVDANTGGPVDDGPEPPSNPDEMCNGLDDDGNGLIDDGLGEIGCGLGECTVIVPACINGAPNPCTPAAPGSESCNGLDDDCDGQVDEGLTQSCATACGDGTETCAGGVFAGCDAPQPAAEACNVTDDDCDGQFDEGLDACRRPVHRSVHPVTGEHFYTTDLGEAGCCGFTVESANFFHLYVDQQPGTTLFFRCVESGGFHFYTTSATCEGQTVEGPMGWIGTSNIAGSVALHRSYRAANGDHFYTTSQAEHDAAITSGGYVDEGIAGWVW